jgi:hypothetical protein
VGTWGPGIFSDDTACDVRAGWRDLIGDGLSAEEATERILAPYSAELLDREFGDVVFVALAVTQWKSGRLLDAVRDEAVAAIDSGRDLHRWADNRDLARRRAQALAKARAMIVSPQPAPVRIARRERSSTLLEPGDVVLYTHDAGKDFVLWVVANKTDMGGTYSHVELVDADAAKVAKRPQRVSRAPGRALHRPTPGAAVAGFLLLGCQRLPADRAHVVGRVERASRRPRAAMTPAFVNPPARQKRIASASLDRRLDPYIA